MTIQYDKKSFVIDGKRVFLNSAAVHYFRMPKEEWRDVLIKAKLAGMNCIDTYFAWNVHEAEEGSFNFEGDNDCGAFMDLCAELGLWVIARPGPFICAEWDFGGYPWWLAKKANMEYRIDHPEHLEYVFRYFDRLLPLISARQLHKGGSVILVQVENEYGYLGESERGKNYMRLLRDGMLARGIEVPLITCVGGAEDTIECANFWSGAKQHYGKLVAKQPDTPKLVTEFWTGWFEHWGGSAALQKTAALYEKRILETIAAGFDGINHYMFFGGTNFGSYGGRTVGSSDIFMITSYDYDAPLDEYGRTTAKYFTAKKLSQFTNVMSEFLLEAEEEDLPTFNASNGLTLSALKLDRQQLLFAASSKEEREGFHITLRDDLTLPVTIEAGGMIPVLDGVKVMDGLSLTMGGYVIGNESYENRQVLIVSGGRGQRLTLLLEAEDTLEWSANDYPSIRYSWLHKRRLQLDLYSFEEPQLITLKANGRLVELIMLNAESTEQAWRVAHPAADWVIGYKDVSVTPEGLLEGVKDESRASLYITNQQSLFSYEQPAAIQCHSYSNTAAKLPQLANWSASPVALDHQSGIMLQRPVGFAEFGQEAGYLLYSHELYSESEKETMIAISALQDSVRVYVNGKEQGFIKDVGAGSIGVQLERGRNTIQFLVQHMGRLNFSPYLGEEKGISGAVYKDAEIVDFRKGWQLDNTIVDLSQVIAADNLKPMRKRWHIEAGKRVLMVGAISENLSINGVQVELEGYSSWFKFHTVDLTSYLQAGPNEFEMQPVVSPMERLQLIVCDEQQRLEPWRVGALKDKGEKETSAALELQGPAWLRGSFMWSESDAPRHARLKLRLTGMSKGFIRLNGRSLGRYWQVGPQEDYKLPLAWLNNGVNTLELFDEQGRSPRQVKLLFDNHTSMQWSELNSSVPEHV